MQSRHIATSRLNLHVIEAGTAHRGNAPSLLLVHGWPQTAHCWHKLIPALAEQRHILAPDLRGFGQSDKQGLPLSRAQLAADLLSLLDQEGLKEVDVVGHDWGGMVALKLAFDAPDRVTRLALVDCSTTHWPHWAAHGLWAKIPGWAEDYFARCHPDFVRWCFAGEAASYPSDVISPFPPQAMPGLDWCDAESLAHYLDNLADPAVQAASISLYRDALPFYRQQSDGHWQVMSVAACQGIWAHPGGPFKHPDYRSALCFAPEDLSKRLKHPVLYVYTPLLQPRGFDSEGKPIPGFIPGGDIFSDSLTAPFTDLSAVGIRSGHFVPEEKPAELLAALKSFLKWI